jgi:hypothetical protein
VLLQSYIYRNDETGMELAGLLENHPGGLGRATPLRAGARAGLLPPQAEALRAPFFTPRASSRYNGV